MSYHSGAESPGRTSYRTRCALAGILAALCVVAALAFAAILAWAVTEHTFNPRLSLRGDCTTNALDEVPDPGLCPGTAGVDHPPQRFEQPCGAATDSHGDIYVASAAQGFNGAGTGGRIDVFNPQGEYLTEIHDEHQPCSVAVDSGGNVYVAEYAGKDAVRFDAKAYPPVKGSTYEPRVIVKELDTSNGSASEACTSSWSVAVDPSNDHLYIAVGCYINEYDSATNGNVVIEEEIGAAQGPNLQHAVVYGKNHDIYTINTRLSSVLVMDGADHHVKCEIDGTETPQGGFEFGASAGIAVDQANGDVYVDDTKAPGHEAVDQFAVDGEECHYIGQIEHSFKPLSIAVGGAALALDDPCLDALNEPCGGKAGYDSPNPGELYVGQGNSSSSYRLYAFKPKIISPPEIEEQAATEVTETEAVLRAKLNPGGKPATYHFEYITAADYEAGGKEFGAGSTSVPIPEADGGEEASFAAVSEPISGLEAGTPYRFRLVASNCEVPGEEECLTEGEGSPGEEGVVAAFSTYAAEAGLPDGRAYELVTPSDTNGRIPTMSAMGGIGSGFFDTLLASPDGKSLVFGTEGGSLPGIGGNGFHDTYEAVRDERTGWQTASAGLSGTQSTESYPGGISPDHLYSFWRTDRGSLPAGNYLRARNGSVEPIGKGNLGVEDLGAEGRWVTAEGGHVIFTSKVHLTPEAPSAGTEAIYERSAGGPTHVVSLLPEGTPPAAGENASYLGASADGAAVAFEVGDTMYARIGNEPTLEVANGESVFGGISQDGDRLFYLRPNLAEPHLAGTEIPQGEIFACDIAAGPCAGPGAHAPIPIGSGEESVFVNVSADGSHVYFISPSQLDGSKGTEGADNLYVWNGSAVRFVATVDPLDVTGEELSALQKRIGGLGLWAGYAVGPNPGRNSGPAADPSRTTYDGSVLVFQSHANLPPSHPSLPDFDSRGHSEVYRYDAENGSLRCLSCNPSGEATVSDAQLQSDPAANLISTPPLTEITPVDNVTSNGKEVFFQTADRLALGDLDGKIDVYEWEANDAGSCRSESQNGGCLYLISSGRSATDDYLYAVTPSGSDVFFESGDLLVPKDRDDTPSIYDARVNGGEPSSSPPSEECLGEACQPAAVAPNDPTPASSSFEGPGNPKPVVKGCPKGMRKARSHGKTRCVKRHKRHHRKHKRNHAKRRASR